MLPEISLNILDITENSVKAKATKIEIDVFADFKTDNLTVKIIDNGCGMTSEQLNSVTNPFFTTRTTRKVGLGIPFYKMAAESTGGSFDIESEVNVGTTVTAVFKLSHIDRMPMGDIALTMWQLITMHEEINFVFKYKVDEKGFTLDTNEFREVLGDISFSEPEVSRYIKDYLKENIDDTLGEKIF